MFIFDQNPLAISFSYKITSVVTRFVFLAFLEEVCLLSSHYADLDGILFLSSYGQSSGGDGLQGELNDIVVNLTGHF